MSQLKINTLGRFEICLDGKVLTWFPTDRVRALLLLLATEPALSQDRLTLAALLWSDIDESAARSNLRSCLARLKKVLGDASGEIIEASRQRIGLLSAESDYNYFQTLASSDTPSDWQKAVALNTNDFAAGFQLKNGSLFDEWLAEKRFALVQKQRELLQKLLNDEEVDPTVQLDYAQQLIASDPYDEDAQRAAMMAHSVLGNTSAALAHFEQYSSFLQDELSAEPEPETRQLYDQLIASNTSRPVSLQNFPRQTAPFIGRVSDRDAVLELLRQDACQMVTILGAGGMGKTCLSSEVAGHLTSADFADGAYFVPLVNATTQDEAIATLHRTLALPMQGNDMLAQLVEHLRNKRLLLVLDNLEQLSGELRFLARLLQTAKGVKILATSRDVVGISVEYRYPLNGISDLHEATAILWGAIKRVAPNFEVTAANIAIGAAICERLHGVPLALELAATWINTLDLDSIREEIEHAYTFLESPMLDTPERHRSLGAIFDHSWGLLQPKRQAILAAASIFRGGFDMKAARAILGAGIHDLRRLIEQSLLTKAEDRPHYTLHELVRQFAAEKLSPDAASRAQQAHAQYYLTLVANFEQQLESEDALAASEIISEDMPNILAAWRWVVGSDSAELIFKSVAGLTRFYRLTGRYSEGNTLFLDTIEQLGQNADAALLAHLHVGCSRLRIGQTQNNRAIDSAKLAVAAATQADDPVLLAESLSCWGQALRAKGAYRSAVPKLKESLATCTTPEAHRIRGENLCNLSIIASFSGAPDRALEFAEEALSVARAASNSVIEVHARNVLTFALTQLYEISKAHEHLSINLALSRQTGNLAGEALVLINRCRVHLFVGMYAKANEAAVAARGIYRSIEDHLGELYALSQLTRSYLMANEYGAAGHYAKQALDLAKMQGLAFHEANVQLMRARMLCNDEQYAEARRLVKEVGQLQSSQQLPTTIRSSVRYGLAEIDFKKGLPEVALAHISAEIDLQLSGQAPLRPVVAPHLYQLGYEILHANSDPHAAQLLQHAYKDIMQMASRITDPEYRQSFLERVPNNSALIALHEGNSVVTP